MKKHVFTFSMLVFMALVGCEDDPEINPQSFTEVKTDINGSWKIDQVTQNGIDITTALDFQSFAMDLDANNFTLTDTKTPFVTTSTTGSWSFDDPTYPTTINFSDGTSAKLLKPLLSGGETKMTLEITLGCAANVYQYKLSK